VSAALAARRRRSDPPGSANPEQAIITPRAPAPFLTHSRPLSPSLVPSFALTAAPGNAAEHSTASAIALCALHRTTAISISPFVAPHPPPPPRRVDCFSCALVRAYFRFSPLAGTSAAIAASTESSPQLGSSALFLQF